MRGGCQLFERKRMQPRVGVALCLGRRQGREQQRLSGLELRTQMPNTVMAFTESIGFGHGRYYRGGDGEE